MTAHAPANQVSHPEGTTTIMGKQRIITLTGRRPVRIDEDDWPQIAFAEGGDYFGLDPARRARASAQGLLDEYQIRVRAHADGRVIVYGTYTRGRHSANEGLTHAGELLSPGSDVSAAIARVGETLGAPAQLVADVIADLPPEDL